MSGNVVTLQPDTVFGLTPEEFAKQNNKDAKNSTSKPEDMKKPMRLEVQPDGKTMKALDDMAGEKTPGDFIFTKQSG
jgi:hypothetical protein